jgi:hypothetical protein
MTTPGSVAPGRTYAIPFDAVWKAALALADGGFEGWHLQGADDGRGVIRARREGALLRKEIEVHIGIGLDENAQTHVELEARPSGRSDPRMGRRTMAMFMDRLDAALDAVGTPIGDAPCAPTWSS